VEKPGVGRGLLLEELYSSFSDPLPYLASKQAEEHGKEPNPNVIPKDSHGQESLADSEPGLVVELFCLDWAEGAIKESLESISYACCDYKGKIDQELARCQLDALPRGFEWLTMRDPVLWEMCTAAE
jgi:hypothetical protein